MRVPRVLGRALVSGMVASVTSVAVLALASRAARGSAPQALNATSHWLHGDGAAQVRRCDLAHTGIGFATHLSATIFWASLHEAWNEARPTGSLARHGARASVVAAFAALVDYTATPRRFTPGWELVISKPAMAAVYAAMAGGFVVAGTRGSWRHP